jgi:hypothetical protein
LIGKSNRHRDAYQRWDKTSSMLEHLSPYASPRMPIHDQANGSGAGKVFQMLAKGNTALFLDIWPLHMFYKKFGLQRFERCLGERALLTGTVVWPVADSVNFGAVTDQIQRGFSAIDAGNINEGVTMLAEHEQLNILQPAMYNAPAFAMLMRANQFAWALNLPTGSAREIQLALVNLCTVTGANAKFENFSKQPLANLADPGQRMEFVLRAAARFDELLRHPMERYSVENSLFLLAQGGR